MPTVDDIRAALLGVIDPELGDNIVDLGMVRDIAVDPDGVATVTVALTVIGCPLQKQLRTDVEGKVGAVPRRGAASWSRWARWMRPSGRRSWPGPA